MGKNITVYVSDELAKKMEDFGEVNWSEIARQGIERYIEGRVTEVAIKNQVPDEILNEFRYYMESIKEYFDSSYVYSIGSMFNGFPKELVTQRERRQFFAIFNSLREDYSELMRRYNSFEQKKNIDEFEPVLVYLMRIFDRYSTLVRDFVLLVKEKADKIKMIGQSPKSRTHNDYLDETYTSFRERYNSLVMGFVKFVSVTRELHKRRIDDHKMYQLLAPRLVDFLISTQKEPEM